MTDEQFDDFIHQLTLAKAKSLIDNFHIRYDIDLTRHHGCVCHIMVRHDTPDSTVSKLAQHLSDKYKCRTTYSQTIRVLKVIDTSVANPT